MLRNILFLFIRWCMCDFMILECGTLGINKQIYCSGTHLFPSVKRLFMEFSSYLIWNDHKSWIIFIKRFSRCTWKSYLYSLFAMWYNGSSQTGGIDTRFRPLWILVNYGLFWKCYCHGVITIYEILKRLLRNFWNILIIFLIECW